MLKITKWHVNPINLVCLVLLSIVTITVLTSNRPVHLERDTDGIVRQYDTPNANAEMGRQDNEYYDTHPLTYRDMKEYQVEITKHNAIFYDYGRVVGVLNLDERNCQLTKLVEKDNQ